MDDRAVRFLTVVSWCAVGFLLIVGVVLQLDAQAAGASFPRSLTGVAQIAGALLLTMTLLVLARRRRQQRGRRD